MMERTGNRILTGAMAVALLLTLAACGDDRRTPAAQSPQPVETSQDSPVEQEPAEDYAIDECLVGVWTTVSQRDEAIFYGEAVVLIDVARQLSFAADGVEVATYLDTPAVVQSPSGEPIGQVTHSGELRYQVSTEQPGTLSFQAIGGEVSGTLELRGQTTTFTMAGGSDPVAYTCSASEHTQNSTGYEAVFTRAT
ncbi:MAG: hypothetical protein M3400_12340 [Actinomycetota bacterium]|nr:hypothetical protein [Actinomycetota bacterium]